jgi:hypothetical protein
LETSSTTSIVGIDSMTLVWGIRKQGSKEELERAAWLFEKLDEEESQVVIASVVLSEFLTPTDPSKHEAIIAGLSQRFILAPFDVRSASLAARLYSEAKDTLQKGSLGGRRTLRADCLIVATAATHAARVFYSGDKNCRSLAIRAGMQAEDLPVQRCSLFGPLKAKK